MRVGLSSDGSDPQFVPRSGRRHVALAEVARGALVVGRARIRRPGQHDEFERETLRPLDGSDLGGVRRDALVVVQIDRGDAGRGQELLCGLGLVVPVAEDRDVAEAQLVRFQCLANPGDKSFIVG